MTEQTTAICRSDTTYWQRLREGDVPGLSMPLDSTIGDLRRSGLSLNAIAERIGRRKSYVQQRLLRIAAREDFENG